MVPEGGVRAQRELVLDSGDTYDPEYDRFQWAWCQVGAPRGAPPPSREWLPQMAMRITPTVDGKYTFLFWAKELLRDGERPPCADGSQDRAGVKRVEIQVGPARRLMLFGLASGDVSVAQPGTQVMSTLRLGADVRVWRRLGIRGGFDLVALEPPQRKGDAPDLKPFGPATLGLSWDLALAGAVSLRPNASFYWHAPEALNRIHLGGGAGLDATVDLADRWALMMTVEGLRVHESKGAYSRIRLAGGLAYRN